MSKISDTAGNPRGREKERIGSVEVRAYGRHEYGRLEEEASVGLFQ